MTPLQIEQAAREAIRDGGKLTLVVPRPWRPRPPGFPRGELLSEHETNQVRSFDPARILTWLDKAGYLSIHVEHPAAPPVSPDRYEKLRRGPTMSVECQCPRCGIRYALRLAPVPAGYVPMIYCGDCVLIIAKRYIKRHDMWG